jgi:hypothetical protein
MVGRDLILSELVGLLADARARRGRSALVLGEPGIGKSTLAEAVTAQATSTGFRVARGWCSAAGDPAADWTPRYDVVLFFECVHDLPRPVEALRHARSALTADGTVIVMDERAADTFTAPGDDVERFLAAASALWCLPQGLVGTDPQPVGALLRPSTMDGLAAQAGYQATETLPIDHPVWRFYRLLP